MLEDLKAEVCRVNRMLPGSGLVQLTWGNVSGYDAAAGILAIKPSGVPYDELEPEHMVLVDLEGAVVEGNLRPSSDTPTHLELYRRWPGIGGVCHTHSPYATVLAQAGRELLCLGTTHADHFNGSVPIVPCLDEDRVREDYERWTGVAIVDHFEAHAIDPLAIPGALLHFHAPFTWGPDPQHALNNSIALEMCARMAMEMWRLASEPPPLPAYVLHKHYQRKHGANATYGQDRQ